jgi:hypothetical protein
LLNISITGKNERMNNLREINQPSPQSPQAPFRNKFFVLFVTNKAVFITLGVLLFLFLSLIFSRVLGQKESAFKQKITPTIEIVPTEAPIPTKSSNSERRTDDLNGANSRPAALAPKPRDNQIPNLTGIPTLTITPTPTPTSDTSKPYLVSISGPEDGSTITYNDFCFAVSFGDNVTSSSDIYTHYKLTTDTDSWSSWDSGSSTRNICYNDIENGSYVFSIQGKDASGNQSIVYKISFTVAVL